jgi:hypothetical protein
LRVLSFFDNAVLRLWARYEVEPGRRIDKLLDDVEREVWTLDAEAEIEQPRTGDFGEDADLPTLRRFLAEVSSLMPVDVKVEANKKKARRRRNKRGQPFEGRGDSALASRTRDIASSPGSAHADARSDSTR